MKTVLILSALLSAVCIPASGHAYQVLQNFNQAEARDATGRITVEASVIHVVACNGAGENGGQFYIYQYVKRPAFRAIRPPDWGHAIGGQDYPNFAQAAAVACWQVALPTGVLTGNWSVKCCNDSLWWTLSITEQRGNSFSGHFSPESGGGSVTNGELLGNIISFYRSGPWGTQRWSAQLVNDRGTLRMMNGMWTGAYLDQYQGRNNWHAEKN